MFLLYRENCSFDVWYKLTYGLRNNSYSVEPGEV